jgi:LacI family transcriptional regulator
MDIREIARRAKVSTATVSRTINRIPTVDPQLAKRVRKVVDELGYFPNAQARALVSGRSRIFGLIVSEITNPFFPERRRPAGPFHASALRTLTISMAKYR